jgi:hypothetical protein
MKRRTLPGAFLAAAWVVFGTAPLCAEPPTTVKTAPVLNKPLAPAPPPDVVAHLKKVGLDPKDPNFRTRLKALAAQQSPTYLRNHVLSITPLVEKSALAARPFPSGHGGSSLRPLRSERLTGAVAGQLVAAYDLNHNQVFPGQGSGFSSPLLYYILVGETAQKFSPSGPASYSLALGCAGLTMTVPGVVVAGDSPFFKGTPFFQEDFGGVHFYWVSTGAAPPFPIGQNRRGTLSVAFDNVSASADVVFVPTRATVTIDLTIDHSPSVTGPGSVSPWGSTGLTGQNARLDSAGTPRVGTGDWTAKVQGTDLLGDGVGVGPGWVVTSTVIKSALSAAAPDDTSPENPWRGASVTLKPQAGSLRTAVAWHYSGVDTLDYTIEWTLTGPLGVRPILTMAKHDSCED